MTIFTDFKQTFTRSSKSQDVYPLAGYCKNSYHAYKSVIERIVRCNIRYEDMKYKEFTISAKGPSGEDLAIIAIWRGSKHAKNVVIRFSGSHGLEGFVGAAGQIYNLEISRSPLKDVAIVEIFGYNVWGFNHLRRVSESQKDYSYCHTQNSSESHNETYLKVTDIKQRKSKKRISMPSLKRVKSKIKVDFTKFKALLSEGQSDYPDGLFYNGERTLDEGPTALFEWLGKKLVHSKRVACIDIHSEPGEWCNEEVTIYDYDGSTESSYVKHTFGKKANILSGDEVPQGNVCAGVYDLVKKVNKNCQFIGVNQTFETFPLEDTIVALAQEQIAHMEYGLKGQEVPMDDESKAALVGCFYPANKRWRHYAVEGMQRLLEDATNYVSEHEKYFYLDKSR